MHYYRFSLDKWVQSTRGLLPEEEGTYLRLVNHYYDTETPIPLDLRKTLKRLNLVPYKSIAEQILDDYFIKTKKGWIHKKCDEILSEFHKHQKINRENGRKGGRPRKTKALSDTETKPDGIANGNRTVTEQKPDGKQTESLTSNLLTSNLLTSPGFPSEKPRGTTGKIVENEVSNPGPVPFEKIIKRWNCEAKKQGLPLVVKTTTTLKGQIRARWTDIPSLGQWNNFIATIMKNDFLSGKAPPGHNRSSPFRATLAWVTKEANFAKIAAGEYN